MMRFLVVVLCLSVAKFQYVAPAGNRTIPATLRFGSATAAYQVEGGWDEDGKSESNWDHIVHRIPSTIEGGATGDIACDSYHKYKEDVAMIKELGLDYYRFSLSWARIIPNGIAGGAVNKAGVEYYRNLMQLLLDNDIEPLVTIFHWDMPQLLVDLGGWTSPELVEHFAYYSRVVFEEFGDLVKLWSTFNEPKQTCFGFPSSGIADYVCAHNILKAHARVYRLYDEEFRDDQGGVISIVANTDWFQPNSDSDEDIEAAERGLQFSFGWFVNPIVNGNYPQVMIDRIAENSKNQGWNTSRLPEFSEDEQEYLKGTYDYIAINTYTSVMVEYLEDGDVPDINYYSDINIRMFAADDWATSPGSSWLHVYPPGIRKLLKWVSDEYGQPELFITENGYADKGGLEDDDRIDYLREYLSNVVDAILDDGVNLTRYTYWSLMDNFEWGSGYSSKFGIYSVDFEDPDRTRTGKNSAAYYKKVVSTRCLVEQCEE